MDFESLGYLVAVLFGAVGFALGTLDLIANRTSGFPDDRKATGGFYVAVVSLLVIIFSLANLL